MKLTINQSNNFTETEIIINCTHMDERLNSLINYIRHFTFSLEGELDKQLYQVPIEKILYFDSVDGKTFFYDTNHTYYHKSSLGELEERLHHTSFARISKNCILNTSYLKCVKPCGNHRMEATLQNGEKLIISRNYISTLKEKLYCQ
ncbi:LytTR family DNA-binding domain-containing protein [Roseburia sp. 499]|uniref:LytTR family DNA-binding domain-containing protein n=1 Tax=Roseburia sp. 499 TaxID=1261634 RepID=UPI0009519F29|nr:LytTR family DNA-binding domain-containing protein [Roseburia sp. 499]WVK68551.1 LytTR family DNA-binding domain-containing protein [Roseburia sp. 499]